MQKNDKKIVVVIEGPSGVGKDSIMLGLINKYPDLFEKVSSYATRNMREGEVDGKPYYFISKEEFVKRLDSGELFEYTERHGNFRGMSKALFDKVLNEGRIPLKDCDLIGLKALRKIYGNRLFGIFITAPKHVIEERLKLRGDKGEDFKKRLLDYDKHMLQKEHFDIELENIDLDKAIEECFNEIKKFYENLGG